VVGVVVVVSRFGVVVVVMVSFVVGMMVVEGVQDHSRRRSNCHRHHWRTYMPMLMQLVFPPICVVFFLIGYLSFLPSLEREGMVCKTAR